MTTGVKAEILKLAPNVPISFRIKYADEVVGNYGPQIRLKGIQVGHTAESYVYLPLDCGNDLLAAGAKVVQTEKGSSFQGFPNANWVIEKRQMAGDKYPKIFLELETAGGKPAMAQPVVSGGQSGGTSPDKPASASPSVPEVRKEWVLLNEATVAATKIAVEALTGALGCEKSDLDQRAIASLTATILIRAEHNGTPVVAGLTKTEAPFD